MLDDRDPLALDPDVMRRMAESTLELVIRRLNDGRAGQPRVPREEMERRLGEPPPEQGIPFDDVLARLDAHVLDLQARADHPGFLAFVPGGSTWPGALADLVASALSLHAISWIESPGTTQVELTVIEWFRRWFGLPDGAGGVFVSGGSAANMTALAVAREASVGAMRRGLVVYLADQAHSSMARAARILGFEPDDVRVLPVDREYRMRPDALAAAMDVDLAEGRRPLLVAATAGATNTGAVDPLGELAAIARERGAWFHVDAAYGGAAVLTERGAAALRGIEDADSITFDPHKWLYQPYECGTLLVRRVADLHRAFEIVPDYLQDTASALVEPNLSDLGMQLTRGARALKVWTSFLTLGVDAFRRAIDRSLDLAERAAAYVSASDRLEIAAPPSLGVVCFRRSVSGGEDEAQRVNAAIVADLASTGWGFVSSTRLRERYVARVCVLNHTTTWGDVERVLRFFETADVRPGDDGRSRGYESRREEGLWVRGRPLPAAGLAGLPLFQGLSEAELGRVEAVAFERLVEEGAVVIHRWTATRDLYVVLDGRAEVRLDDGRTIDLASAEVFGEIAAIDWGAGFRYARTATVVAVTPLRLLVIPASAIPDLLADLPIVRERLDRTARERLRDV